MLPHFKTTALAAVTALSVALTTAAPAEALGRNERNFLKGVAAAVIVGALINDARARTVPAPRPQPQPQPQYRPRPYQEDYRPNEYRPAPRYEERRSSGRVIGSSQSVQTTIAAQAFNSYSVAQRRSIQTRLRSFGYYNGGIDGTFGPGTLRAVEAYARDSGGAAQLQTRAGTYGVYDSLIY
ncbi:MAG: peptidoglycan-binding domain-containing protein [Paracoccaceae bacterium]